jgi:deazaflavin-dependent oxidoreductase (nitroreductase family)
MEDELAAWGKVITLETRGRRSGLPRRVAVGFIETPDGLLVAAADDDTQWARNLAADERCHVELAGVRSERRAVALDDAGRDAAVAALILKYGTPSERLGSGPAFRLEPTEPVPPGDARRP